MSDKQKLLKVFNEIGIKYSKNNGECDETIIIEKMEYKTKGIHNIQEQKIFTFKFDCHTGKYLK